MSLYGDIAKDLRLIQRGLEANDGWGDEAVEAEWDQIKLQISKLAAGAQFRMQLCRVRDKAENAARRRGDDPIDAGEAAVAAFETEYAKREVQS